jgi:multidrug efflux pump subunit AcrB
MDFSKFFINRPIFAIVLSIIIFSLGLIAIPMLPSGEYPEVVPPSVFVRATYPRANPKEIAESVAEPLEEAINGVEGIMYLKSVAGSDGSLQVVVTFRPGVDPDTAAVRVQNRVSEALSRLPDEVRQYGVTTQKQSPTPLMYVSLYSPDNLASVRFKNGATGLLDLLDAERVELQAEDAYAENHSNSALSAVLLYKSLAGGWPQTLPPAVRGGKP